MGIRLDVEDYVFDASDYSVSEDATPLAAGDSSGGVGSLSFTLPIPDPDIPQAGPSTELEWTEQDRNIATNPGFRTTGVINPIKNPSFEVNTTGWAASTATLTRVAGGTDGSWHARLAATGASALNATVDSNGLVPVVAGQWWSLSADVWGEGTGIGQGARMRFFWYNSSNTIISQPNGDSVTLTADAQTVTATLQAPANAVSLRPSVQMPTSPSGSIFHIDNVVANIEYIEVRRNLFLNPLAKDVGGTAQFGFGPNLTGAYITDFPVVGTAYETTALTPGANSGLQIRKDNLVASTIYTISLHIRTISFDDPRERLVNVSVRPNMTSATNGIIFSTFAVPSANSDFIVTLSGATGAFSYGSVSGFNISWTQRTAGAKIAVTELMCEVRSTSGGDFFYPGDSPDPDLTSLWTGTADASESVLVGVPVRGVRTVSTSVGYLSSSGDVVIHPTGTGNSPAAIIGGSNTTDLVRPLIAGNTYTALATLILTEAGGDGGSLYRRIAFSQAGFPDQSSDVAPNIPGEYPLRFTFTFDASSPTRNLVLGGSGNATSSVRWKDVAVVEGEYDGPYFDGDSVPRSLLDRYSWIGVPDDSASIYETAEFIPSGAPIPVRTGNQDILKFGPQILLDKSIRLTDSRKGFTLGSISGVAINEDAGTIQITCDSRLGVLNMYGVKAQPFVGTLADAFDYYLGLASIETDLFVDDSIASRPVVFPGWTGELWYYLKQMAVAQDCDLSLVSGVILLRPIRGRIATKGRDIARTRENPAGTLAQSVEVYQYNNRQITDELVYPPGGWTPDVEVMNVNAGETTTYQLQLSASVSSIVQPTFETFVSEDDDSESVYTIVANDGLPVSEDEWLGGGGYLTVSINPDTVSLTVTLRGPTGLETTAGDAAATNFSVALASDTTGNRYSTFRILGTGVAFDKVKKTIPTGVPATRTATEVGVTIDNPFIGSVDERCRAGVRAAKQYSGQVPTLSGTVTAINRRGDSGVAAYPTYAEVQTNLETALGTPSYDDVEDYYHDTLSLTSYESVRQYWFSLVRDEFTNQVFGNVNGARIYDKRSRRWYRIRSGTIQADVIQFNADDDLTHGDVEGFYVGKTYGDVELILGGLSYKQAELVGLYAG